MNGTMAQAQNQVVHTHTHTGKATKGKVQDIDEVNKVMPFPLPSGVLQSPVFVFVRKEEWKP